MTLIKSISGIRGTVGGACGESLTPVDIVKFTYAYCERMRRHASPKTGRFKVVVGRDARISGPMVEQLVCGTLVACGVDVVRCGLASTPTTELAVRFAGADGAAEEIVQELDPDYAPIAQPILEPPGGETESLLFCLQAALGAGVLGFGFGWLAARKKYQGGASAESPSEETP